MKVKELIKELNKIQDLEQKIWISIDEEGNDFRPIDEICYADGQENFDSEKIEGYIIYPN